MVCIRARLAVVPQSFASPMGFSPCSQRLKPLSLDFLVWHDWKSCPDTNRTMKHAVAPSKNQSIYFFSFTSTLAMVVSHSNLSVAESPPVLSKEMVNCSSGDERWLTFMSTRARSWLWS